MGRFRFTANYFRRANCILALTGILGPVTFQGQSVVPRPQPSGTATLQGFVRDSGGRPVANATVCLQANDARPVTVRTDSAGAYRFSALDPAAYSLRAEMTGYVPASFNPIVLGEKESRTIDLTLALAKPAGQDLTARPEFFDEPHFTVAGVTDTTSLGGHGSDAILRNREALVKATISLSEPSPGNAPPVSKSAPTEKSLRQAVSASSTAFPNTPRISRTCISTTSTSSATPASATIRSAPMPP